MGLRVVTNGRVLRSVQIFFTFLISFVLRVLVDDNEEFAYSEPASKEFYGYLLLGSWAVTVAAGVALTVDSCQRNRAFRRRLALTFDGRMLGVNAGDGGGGSGGENSDGEGEELADYSRSEAWGDGSVVASQALPESGLFSAHADDDGRL